MRALACVLAGGLAAFSLIAWAALPALPVVGFTIATMAMVVNKVTSRLDRSLCRDCGATLDPETLSAYGIACPECGFINPPGRDDTLA
ncbi:MAG: hypothetical protein H6811_06280 [Phycisphaeraceae bacterium]|nr:hypothetical protein [Phycisphaeraceae bacterium]